MSCRFKLRGASEPNAVPQALLPVLPANGASPLLVSGRETRGESRVTPDVPRLIAGSLLECEYRLGREVEWEHPLVRTPSGRLSAFGVGSRADSSAKGLGKSGRSTSKESFQDSIRRIEHSFLWQTTGKGERDFAIHYFEQRTTPDGAALSADSTEWCFLPCVFRTVCPLTPLTYHGHLLAIEWLVRVRVFFLSGQQVTFEQAVDLVPA